MFRVGKAGCALLRIILERKAGKTGNNHINVIKALPLFFWQTGFLPKKWKQPQ